MRREQLWATIVYRDGIKAERAAPFREVGEDGFDVYAVPLDQPLDQLQHVHVDVLPPRSRVVFDPPADDD
jgi:hypothetical protein